MAHRINQRDIRKHIDYNDNESTTCQKCEMQKEITEINDRGNKTKCWFCEKTVQTDKPVSNIFKKQKKKTKIIYIRIKRRNIKTDPIKRARRNTVTFIKINVVI